MWKRKYGFHRSFLDTKLGKLKKQGIKRLRTVFPYYAVFPYGLNDKIGEEKF